MPERPPPTWVEASLFLFIFLSKGITMFEDQLPGHPGANTIDYLLVHRAMPRNDTKIFRLEDFTVKRKNLDNSRKNTLEKRIAPAIEFYLPLKQMVKWGSQWDYHPTDYVNADCFGRVGFEVGDLQPKTPALTNPIVFSLDHWRRFGICLWRKRLCPISEALDTSLEEINYKPDLIQPEFMLTVLSRFSAPDYLEGI